MLKFKGLIWLLLLVWVSAAGNTPAEIKARLESIIPRDTIVKLAYLKDGPYSNFAPYAPGNNVYVVSSEDGVIRRVNTVTGDLCMVNITADGKRVLFHDKKSGRAYIVDWDGKNEKVISNSGLLLEYWRDQSSGTDWAIIESGGQYRINVDALTSRVTLSPYGCGGLGGGLSDDGKRLLVFNDGWGTAAVGSTQIQKGWGGCQASMRPGPIAQWSCNESGHGNVFVNNPDGTVAFKISMGTNDTTGEGARFTQHPNFFTYMRAYRSEKSLSSNPILHRVSDNRRIGIEDGRPSDKFIGDVDAVFLPAGTVAVAHNKSRLSPAFGLDGKAARSFSITGRHLGLMHELVKTSVKGVVVTQGRTHALVRPIILR